MASSAPKGLALNGLDAPEKGADCARSAMQEAIVEIIDSMEQGVIVWSEDAVCKMHNQRIFDVLELSEKDLYPGLRRSEFLRMAVERGEFSQDTVEKTEKRFAQLAPFSFDRIMPSGSVVATTARPVRSGGFVVTFTDVTEARRKEVELEAQREKSRAAELKANEALVQERERKREARGLSQLDEWLQSCKSLDELLIIVGKFLARLFPGSAGELYIYSNSRDVLDGACSWGIATPRAHIQPDECWGLRRGRLYQYRQGSVNFTCNHVEETISDAYQGQFICIPIIAHGDTVGLLHIRFEDAGRETPEDPATGFSDSTVDFALRCSERISLAIANVKLRDELRDQSTKDPLTGLYNRRYFLDVFHREINHAARNNQEVGLISLDADHFKNFNDTHGHDAGDLVLRAISDMMKTMFETDGVVARFGGEEFSILMPAASAELCRQRADSLRKKIEANVLHYHDRVLPKVTVSIGIAVYPASGTTPRALLSEADRALYKAKDAGRNRVVLASSASGREAN